MKRRIFACLLALAMLVSVLPVALAEETPVAKIGDDTYGTLDAAVDAATAGQTVELLQDTQENIKIEKPVTLDLGGHTLDGGEKGTVILVSINEKALKESQIDMANASITIRNGTVTGGAGSDYGGIGITGAAGGTTMDIFLTGLTIKGNDASKTFCSGVYINYGNVEIRGCSIIENNNGGLYMTSATGDIGSGYSTSCHLIDSHVNGNINGGITVGAANFSDEKNITATLTVENSEICNNTKYGGIRLSSSGTRCTIESATISGNISTGDGGGVCVQNYSGVEIKRAAITNNTARNGGGIYVKGALDKEIEGVTDRLILGKDVVITGNQATGKNSYGNGGGLYIDRSVAVTVADGVQLYNNHANTAGDDIYSYSGFLNPGAYVGPESTMTIPTTEAMSGDKILLDDGQPITGWYIDGMRYSGEPMADDKNTYDKETTPRWSKEDENGEKFYEIFQPTDDDDYVYPVALKAAHGPEDPIADYLLPALWLNTKDHYSYLIGYADGTVKPEGKITRAEVATIFFRLLTDDARAKFWMSTNNYTDVPAGKWYNNAISTLSNMGVIGGYADGTFKPDAPISRAEFAKIAVSFSNVADLSYRGYFADVKESDWFSGFVAAAKDAGLIEGYNDGTFQPKKAITRAEVCTIVNRTLGRKPSASHMKISDRIDWPDVSVTDWYYEAVMEATNSHTYQMGQRIETWNDKLPQRDWALLETGWANAYTGNGGEVH